MFNNSKSVIGTPRPHEKEERCLKKGWYHFFYTN